MEMNPNHPATQAMHDQWHKVCAILMAKLGEDHVVITMDDVRQLDPETSIVFQELGDGIHLRMVGPEEAERLAREHGGLPT